MTDTLDLDAIRARAEAATPGPWHGPHDGEFGCVVQGDFGWVTPGLGPEYDQDTDQGQADAEFVAHAREDVPDLLAELGTMTEIARGNKAHVATLMGDYEQLLAERDEARRLATLTSVDENAVAQVLEDERRLIRPLLDALRSWFEAYSRAEAPSEVEMASLNATLAYAMAKYNREARTDA